MNIDYLKQPIPVAHDFTYWEFIRSDMALRRGINNIPNKLQLVNIERLARMVMQPIRNRFGAIRITSGYRCQELNKAIGSTLSSLHVSGHACDFEPVDNKIKLIDVIKWIVDNLEYRELIAEYFPHGWIHIAYSSVNSKKLKLKDKDHNYSKVTIEELMGIYGESEG